MRSFPTQLSRGALGTALALVLAGVPVATGAAGAPAAAPVAPAAAPGGPSAHGRPAGAVPTLAPDPDDPHTWQTSDRVPGEIARPVPRNQRMIVQRRVRYRYDVAPGVRAVGWDETTARGRVRLHLLRIAWEAPGVKVDYLHPPTVQTTEPVRRTLNRTPRAIAGVNGDFFDIGDTGAPLGLGRARGDGLLNGIDYGWNAAFWFGRGGRPNIDVLNMVATITAPDRTFSVTNVNSPQVKPGGIGIYTPKWGPASGAGWTDGQRRDVRVVRVKDGRVVANRAGPLPDDVPIKGYYLIARGAKPAATLAKLAVGTPLGARYGLPAAPPMAITGNQILLKQREVLAYDNREMHPRTAVGIDRDGKQILLLVVDGRQSFSRGYTMVEIARQLRSIGAEDALNLDGGGSSTMVARHTGRLRVLNSPSDGRQRAVPNGLQVVFHPGAARRR